LRSRYEDIKALNTEVVVISFSTGEWAQAWLNETQAPFSMLLDPKRAAYSAYGLDHSLLRSWGPKTIWQYARLLLTGRRRRGIQGDSGQLGGDFIVDTTGVIRFSHPSRNPTDRPSVDRLLAGLNQIKL